MKIVRKKKVVKFWYKNCCIFKLTLEKFRKSVLPSLTPSVHIRIVYKAARDLKSTKKS